MHDVLDPRDLVPDEVEHLLHSGHDVAEYQEVAATAAAAGDLDALAGIERTLWSVGRRPDWSYDEPEDEATLLALTDVPSDPPTDRAAVASRIQGAWLGRAVGNTLGKPVEGLTRSEIERYLRAAGQWPQRGYLPLLEPLPAGVPRLHPSAPTATAGRFSDVPRDDDIDWTILGLHLLERHGRSISTEQIGTQWLDRVPFTQTYTAERAAYRNLILGLAPPQTATHRNPYREWIGALIRADIFGYANPGDPGAAARLALTDARLSHTANGIYGEMWAAALVAAAFTASGATESIERAMTVVPPRSRLREVLESVLDLHLRGVDQVAALDWVDRHLGHYSWVHTLPNAALIAIALLWGKDFMGAAAISIQGGRDTDSTTATVGSVYGVLHGASAIPAELVGTTHVRVRSAVRDYDRVTIAALAERTVSLLP